VGQKPTHIVNSNSNLPKKKKKEQREKKKKGFLVIQKECSAGLAKNVPLESIFEKKNDGLKIQKKPTFSNHKAGILLKTYDFTDHFKNYVFINCILILLFF
jgi:hypothetical protein